MEFDEISWNSVGFDEMDPKPAGAESVEQCRVELEVSAARSESSCPVVFIVFMLIK